MSLPLKGKKININKKLSETLILAA